MVFDIFCVFAVYSLILKRVRSVLFLSAIYRRYRLGSNQIDRLFTVANSVRCQFFIKS